MKYVLIGLLKLYRSVDQPALWERVPLLPELFGVRAPGGPGTRSRTWQLAGGSTAGALPPLGRGVGMTPYREPLNSTKRCVSKRGVQQQWVRVLSWRHNEV